ncbi:MULTISPECIES: hypothetical protein [unclassified Bradyrhizobium]|uniref:hypothetical protein n=1 Tax=unclassified Bradyrhizobium TaxID=2631580 RepID=UPI0028EA36E7|nr:MULTISPECIES: hypothetical protein [unclassified Bradyrhizobium]
MIEPSKIERYSDERFLETSTSRKPTWTASHGDCSARAWISGLRREFCSDFGFLSRTVSFLISQQERGQVAVGNLHVWRSHPDDEHFPNLEGFLNCCDMISQDSYNSAYVVSKLWGGEDEGQWGWTDKPFAYGDLIIFNRLVSDAQKSKDISAVWALVNELLHHLQRISGKHLTSAIMLKAFPLEFEGNVDAKNKKKFERRKRALMRHYRQRMGFEPVPNSSLAKEGWMLKLINSFAAPEKRRRRTARNPEI